ncbi:MAG: bifunctional pyr operon transcriptional regulator/uracil phosphoribosyltransferase PyrR [Deltaproteobacteria bacterium]|nr:bifunctional pyr operon transcriptional regulator/uracil phosphoribosyltransferase PyrR [Deltaproteobacteria bacterium]
MEKTIILDAQGVSDNIQKIADQILPKNQLGQNVVLVGIRTGGAFLAARLQKTMGAMDGPPPPLGIVDITLYRDDWTRMAPTPVVGKTDLPFSLDDKIVILVDDVLFTGRTVRAAMDALIDYGRPRKIELAILADRGVENRELPIMANYVGGVWDTAPEETINVYLEEEGFEDYVAIERKEAP